MQEMRYFVDNIVAAECGALWEHSHIFKDMGVDMVFDNLSKAIEAACDEEFQSKALPVATPRDFEAHCADVLNCLGWVASLTRASGDQGVDVIARKGNVSLAVQCKLYSGPVGNKAVQEVAAGRKHYSVDYAIVVSDAGFTASARALATTNNVLLLSTADFTLFATEIAEE